MKLNIWDVNDNKYLLCYFDIGLRGIAQRTVNDMNTRYCMTLPKLKDKKKSVYQVVERYILKEVD